MPNNYLHFLISFVLLSSNQLFATADGPDYYKVRNVKENDKLNLRSGPGLNFSVVARIPYNTTQLKNMGECHSNQKTNSTPSQVWCRIGFLKNIGWVNAKFIIEDTTAKSAVNITPTAPLQVEQLQTITHADKKWRLMIIREEIYPSLVYEEIAVGRTEGDQSILVKKQNIREFFFQGRLHNFDSGFYNLTNLETVGKHFKFNILDRRSKKLKVDLSCKMNTNQRMTCRQKDK